jgi:hypothetical protein
MEIDTDEKRECKTKEPKCRHKKALFFYPFEDEIYDTCRYCCFCTTGYWSLCERCAPAFWEFMKNEVCKEGECDICTSEERINEYIDKWISMLEEPTPRYKRIKKIV